MRTRSTRATDKIGMLGADAADVVRFYTNMVACRVNLRVFVTGKIKGFSIERRIEWVENLASIWQPTKALGESLVMRLGSRRRSDSPVPARPTLSDMVPRLLLDFLRRR
jgi:hypothetical protein